MSTAELPGAGHMVTFRPLGLIALSAVMVLAYASGLAMPFNMQAVLMHFQTTNTVAGAISAGELLAISLTSFFAARYAGRIDVRRALTAGIIVIVLANLATTLVSNIVLLAAVRVIAGCGAGPVIALVMSLAGRSDNPRVTFGATNSAIGVIGMFLAVGVPTVLAAYGMAGAYAVYAALAVLALPLVALVPAPPPVAHTAGQPVEVPKIPGVGWAALIGLALILLGNGVLMMLIFIIGTDRHIPPTTLKLIFFIASFVMAIGPMLAGYLGSKVSATGPIAIILLALVVCAYLLANLNGSVPYIICGPLFAFLPIIMLPIALAALSMVDPSGRTAGTFPAFMTFAAAFAPFIGGRTADMGGYPAVGWVSIACIIGGGLLMARLALLADRIRRAG